MNREAELDQIIGKLHSDGALMGLVNDGKPHKMYSHATGDKCESEAKAKLNSLIDRLVIEGQREEHELWRSKWANSTGEKSLKAWSNRRIEYLLSQSSQQGADRADSSKSEEVNNG